MRIDYEKTLKLANELYATAKLDKGLADGYTPPEFLKIKSDQVKAVLRALIEAINQEDAQ